MSQKFLKEFNVATTLSYKFCGKIGHYLSVHFHILRLTSISSWKSGRAQILSVGFNSGNELLMVTCSNFDITKPKENVDMGGVVSNLSITYSSLLPLKTPRILETKPDKPIQYLLHFLARTFDKHIKQCRIVFWSRYANTERYFESRFIKARENSSGIVRPHMCC